MSAVNSDESEEDDDASVLQTLRDGTQVVRNGIYFVLMLFFGSFTKLFVSLGIMFTATGWILDMTAKTPTGNMKVWAGISGIWAITCFIIVVLGNIFFFIYRRYV